MSARERLVDEYAEAEAGAAPWTLAEFRSLLCTYRDEVAHELAEKIRREADELDGWPEAQHVMRKDADLIDPEERDD